MTEEDVNYKTRMPWSFYVDFECPCCGEALKIDIAGDSTLERDISRADVEKKDEVGGVDD
ncbi:MAG: hypothetical protein EF811_03875 [Methanonatronarchaeia archaeon]|nr:MAG: hypothetical protein EF811_03875 [Methanonatronarchaeia archaeon]